ncbi:hypothetical protein GOP47_0007051 [Adiantum capillus-veneris]|uniref:Major facilitator superfamily (MFS) profile domain-containing protein n=1 Tax=Adiantum capillus-veneris TaxID=13818 RepID=A0A9D4ZKJ1_ADICA|nr:hypothetical protein GOP47_0007051 [Adiantum capillus-veneris]
MAGDEAYRPLLLQEKPYFDGCSGCLVERRKAASKGAPKKEFALIAFMVLCNALPISSIFPFIYFMVRDFGIAKADTQIATYAGYIGSSLMVGRFLSSTLWGILADRYGRKPTIIVGTASIFVFNTIFGFSTNFWIALASRFSLGLVNGMLGPVRAYASEICTEEYQALGLSLVGTMWGLGLVIGPAIGGYLAQPSDKYPSLFSSGSLFDRFPYALPCLCISAISFLGLPLSFLLPETIHTHKGVSNSSAKRKQISNKKSNSVEEKKDGDSDIVELSGFHEAKRPLWRNWGMVAAISIYSLWGLHDMAYSEIFSLWCVSPETYGGLGLTTSDVGNILSAAGAALLVFQLFVFAPLANRFGAIQIIRVPIVMTLPLVAVYPLIARLDGVSLWIAIIPAACIKNVLSLCIITGLFILINNSAPTKQRGFVNGISMTCMSLFKAIGPASAGVVFSWAEGRMDASFLPGMWMVFFLLDIVVVIILAATFEPMLPRSLLQPVQEESERSEPSTKDAELQRAASFTF